MNAELRRSGHPMLATLLTASLSGLAQGESPAADPANVTDSAPLSNVNRRSIYNDVQGTMNRFWHDKAEVAVSAFNALNDKHQEYPLGEMIGHRVMGWLTVRF